MNIFNSSIGQGVENKSLYPARASLLLEGLLYTFTCIVAVFRFELLIFLFIDLYYWFDRYCNLEIQNHVFWSIISSERVNPSSVELIRQKVTTNSFDKCWA